MRSKALLRATKDCHLVTMRRLFNMNAEPCDEMLPSLLNAADMSFERMGAIAIAVQHSAKLKQELQNFPYLVNETGNSVLQLLLKPGTVAISVL